MFQSKLFRKMLLTYLVIVLSYMILCVSFLAYMNVQLTEMQISRFGEIQLSQVSSILDRRVMRAQNIAMNLRYSSSMKRLYMNARMGEQLDSWSLYSIQSEMSATMKAADLAVYKTVLFVDDSDRAYSSSGVIILEEPYSSQDRAEPYLTVGTVNDAFQLNNAKRYSFNKECLLYCDSYAWQNGTDIGTLCILFDLNTLNNDIRNVLGDDCGVEILVGETPIYSYGETTGRVYSGASSRLEDVTYVVYAAETIGSNVNHYYYMMLSGIVLISLLFVAVAYWQSRRYYKPIEHMERMITATPDSSGDEMAEIISGIQNLIGERNRYSEKMLTIEPYARTGMLQSMISGNAAEEYVRVIMDENYLDLIKPYFVVSLVNFAYDEALPPVQQHRERMESVFGLVTETFSTDETHLVYYCHDIYNVYLIVNSDVDQRQDELFEQIHQHISAALSDVFCSVTMGVDVLRNDIGELKEACEGATKALDGILTDGRGAVYFLEETVTGTSHYYFPADFRERLSVCIRRQDRNEIHRILYDIYKTNAAMDGTSEMYRSLIDEMHLSVIKTLREMTELNTVHVNIAKYTNLATLQDIFDYYDAALISVVDTMQEQAARVEADSHLAEDIVSYMDEHYCDADLSLQSLTDRFNVSNKYLIYLCKERYGMTYLQYIQDRRIHRAADLLRSGQYSLTQISTMCGYTNQLTFRRNFKRIMGVNPGDYDKEIQ